VDKGPALYPPFLLPTFPKLTYMLINKYVNFRKLYSAPLAIKSERQLDFSQPIDLALGSTDSIT